MPRPRLIGLLIAVWSLVVLLAYHSPGDNPEPFHAVGLLRLLVDVARLSLIAGAAWGLGAAILRAFSLPAVPRLETAILCLGAGLGGLAIAVLLVSALGILRPSVLAGLVTCGVLLLGVEAMRGTWRKRVGLHRREAAVEADPAPWTTGQAVLAALLGAAALITLPAALAPPEFYDALIYHLAVPEQYLRHHGMVPIEGNYYASFPANMGMLYALGLALGGGPLAQSIHWLCGALAAAGLSATAARHAGRGVGLLAGGFFALTPGVMLSSTWAIADLGVALFATLCFACVLNLRADGNPRWAPIAGLFAGLALGTKYTAAVTVAAPAVAGILAAVIAKAGSPERAGFKPAARRVASFGLVAAAVLAPWLARNAIVEGNPVAPYFSSVFAGEARGGPELAEEMQRRLPRDAGAADLVLHYLTSPWRVTMLRLGQAGYLGPVFLMLIPALALMRGLPRVAVPAALMAATGFAGWALTSQVTRYLFPVVPLLALLAALAASRLPRLIAAAASGWALLYGVYLYVLLIETIGSYRVITGAESAEQFLTRRVSYYAAARYMDTLPSEAKVLLIGEGRTFYVPRACVASTPFDRPAIERYAPAREGAGREAGLLQALRADGITHLLVSDPELRRTSGVDAATVMRAYFPGGGPRRLFEGSGVGVYALP